MKRFKVWKTVTINSKPNLKGINVSSYAQDMLDKITWDTKQTLDLVRIQVKDLGIKEKYPTTKQIFEKAKHSSLDLCPPQVSAQLRVDYTEQPLYEWLFVAIEPIADRDGYPLVFYLLHNGDGLWLNDDWAEPGSRWNSINEFVFALRKDSLKLKPLKSLNKKHFDSSDSLEKRVKELERFKKKVEKGLNI